MKKLLFLLCILCTLVACKKDETSSEVIHPTERTVVVYMSGENGLSSYVQLNIDEMKEGSRNISDNSCLLVYVDRSKKSELPWLARIRGGNITDSVSLKDMGISEKNEYASDPRIMEQVLKYAVHHYPASRDYGLVLWGHSSGWLMADSLAYTPSNRRAYGVDNGIKSAVSDDGMWLNIPSMASMLSSVGVKWKFLFADCCNFMCLETLYELRHNADYIIGSPAEIPQDGAPYVTVVPAMFSRDNFCNEIIDKYYAFKSKGLDLPLVAVKCSELDRLASATKKAVKAAKAQQTGTYPDLSNLIYYSYNDPQFFHKAENCIFYDAGDYLLAKAPQADYEQWKQAFQQVIVRKTFSAKWDTAKAWDKFFGGHFTATEARQHCLTMYIPQKTTDDAGKDNHHAAYMKDIKKMAWYYAVWP